MRNSVNMSAIVSLLQGYTKREHSLAQLLIKVNESKDLLEQPEARLPTRKLNKLLTLARESLNDETLGLLDKKSPPGTFEMSMNSCIHYKTLGIALEKYFFFWSLVHQDFLFKQSTNGEITKITLEIYNPDLENSMFSTYAALLLLRLSSWLTNRLFIIDRLNLRMTEPASAYDYQELFPCQVNFNHKENSFSFHRESLNLPIVKSHSDIFEFTFIAENIITQKGVDKSLTGEIKRMFFQGDEIRPIMLKTVSEVLGISTDTIRRRLKKEENSFAEIKESIKRDRALFYLESSEVAISKISELAGFSEPATFNRAFKKWTGKTPGDYRKTYKEQF